MIRTKYERCSLNNTGREGSTKPARGELMAADAACSSEVTRSVLARAVALTELGAFPAPLPDRRIPRYHRVAWGER